MFEQPSQRLCADASDGTPRPTRNQPPQVQKAASMTGLDTGSLEHKQPVKGLLSRISLPKFSMNRKKSYRSMGLGTNSSNSELPASEHITPFSELQPPSARSSSSGSSTKTQRSRPTTSTPAEVIDFTNLFTRPRPRPIPTPLPQPQLPTPTLSAYAANTSEPSMKELLHMLKLLSVQYDELLCSIVKIVELHALGIRKLEEVMAERENHIS